jgi:hypothetical protein
MLISISTIYIKRIPSDSYPTREGTFVFDFVCEWEASDNWEDFTNKAKITLPKNVYYTDRNGRKVNLGNTATPLSGFEGIPSFLKGDEVEIVSGYRYRINNQEIVDYAVKFEGFISQVSSKKPFVLECEDNMWKLKQIPAPNKLFRAKNYDLEGILKELLTGTGFTVNTLTQTSIGDFRTQNETICDVLARLRKEFHFESYFRGTELRCGSVVYIESEAKTHKFIFQQNIIDDDLTYNRKDDIVLSAIAYSINKNELQTVTKDGHKKTKHERLEVLVTYQRGTFVNKVKAPGQKAEFPPNYTGERRTLYFWNVTDINLLTKMAQDELMKYYYTGFKGKFTTFGIPHVKQGDNVRIEDKVLTDRNGTYKVKGVEYSGGVNGMRQVIELDYKLNIS